MRVFVFRRWLIVTLALVASAVFFIGFYTVYSVLDHFDGTVESSSFECGVVFGAAVHKGNRAGPGIARRVRTAVRLYHEGVIERLYMTGGVGDGNSVSEAEVMRDVALQLGVDDRDIVLEKKSRTTEQNIAFTKPLLEGCKGTVGISDRYHLRRIALLAQKKGLDLETIPADWTAGWQFEFLATVREIVGVLYTALFV